MFDLDVVESVETTEDEIVVELFLPNGVNEGEGEFKKGSAHLKKICKSCFEKQVSSSTCKIYKCLM